MPAILLIHSSDERYGADRCLLETVRALPAGWRVIVALPRDVPGDGWLSRQLVAAGARVERRNVAVLRRALLHPGGLARLAWQLVAGTLALTAFARREQVDLVYSSTLAVLPGPLVARLLRAPHVWHLHEDLRDEPPAIRTAYRLFALAAGGTLVANSAATARALAGRSSRLNARLVVVPNGVARPPVPPPLPPPGAPGYLRAAFAGRLAPRKGLSALLQALALLRARGIVVELHVAGGPPPGRLELAERYQREVERLGLGQQVRFHGLVEDVPALLREVEVVVVPSQRPESFGLAIAEGMASARAVVATRTGGGSDELIVDGDSGLLCARTPDAIAAALELLARDRARIERLSRVAWEQAGAWTTERYRERMAALLAMTLDNGGIAPLVCRDDNPSTHSAAYQGKRSTGQ